jgi:hypothetical protein
MADELRGRTAPTERGLQAKGIPSTHCALDNAGQAALAPGPAIQHIARLLTRIEPHWLDLLHQGSIVKKFPKRPDSPYVLQFRQNLSGTRDGRQKRLYLGPKDKADALMDEIRRRRKEATGSRPGHSPARKPERPLTLGQLRLLRAILGPMPGLEGVGNT